VQTFLHFCEAVAGLAIIGAGLGGYGWLEPRINPPTPPLTDEEWDSIQR